MVLVQYPSADNALAHSITLMLPFVRSSSYFLNFIQPSYVAG